MHLLFINFTATATPEEFDTLVRGDAPTFAGIDGLVHKYFIFNHEEKTYGGCYLFESKEAMDAYKVGDIYNSIIDNPDWSNHLVRDYEVHAGASEIQNKLKRTNV
ncbi:YdhR family protein [Pseudopelagicola sp. nBUS_20]|uniref:YdhR family protein n=1 Tax=Pseudopelagicola sp. nBUS_20 TaxID=3395317 RepID=UPI003EBE5383